MSYRCLIKVVRRILFIMHHLVIDIYMILMVNIAFRIDSS